MPGDLFRQPWFSGPALHGVNKHLHGELAGLGEMETRFLADLCWHMLGRDAAGDLPQRDLLRFFGYALAQRPRSFAQLHQDLWVLHMTGEKRGGFFVEFGACDGVLLSNTLLLEREFGWRGILAEPNPQFHAALAQNRTAAISTACVAGRTGERVAFDCAGQPELSRLHDVVPDDVHERQGTRRATAEVLVETISLEDLLATHGAPEEIDYLSIDTEGSELLILAPFDFSRRRIRLLTVEHAGEAAKREGLHRLLSANGYRRWFPDFSRWDDWYVREAD